MATTVSISWTAPTASNPNPLNNIQRYEIELSEDQFNISTIKENTTSTSITITGLEEYNTYKCKVAAVNSVGVGTFSVVVNFTTSESGRYIHVKSYCGEVCLSTIFVSSLSLSLSPHLLLFL